MYQDSAKVPQRETEINKVIGKLAKRISQTEETVKQLSARLTGYAKFARERLQQQTQQRNIF